MSSEKTIYYHDQKVHHNLKSPEIIIPIVLNKINVNSVIDIGCGLGGWLKVFENLAIHNYIGVDGEHVNRKHLLIPESKFIARDLTAEINIDKHFDLAICLEVAEHLPERSADNIVKTLTNHADTILFSAALIGQEGQNHINEQWFSYWQEKFKRQGYFFYDEIRPIIWWNNEVEWWYKQNIFVVSKNKIPSFSDDKGLVCGYHPEWYKKNAVSLKTLKSGNYSSKQLTKFLFRSIIRKLFGRKYDDNLFK
jgi:hypothetical protein